VGRMKGGIRISMYNVWVGGARGRLYNTEKTSSDSTASYYTLMESDCNGVWGGHGEGVYSIQLC